MRASELHQTPIKLLLAAATGAAIVAGAPASAEVVSFYFRGGVGVTILQSGLIQDAGLSATDWLGRTVSGTASDHSGLVRHSVFGPASFRHRRDSVAYAGWLSLSFLHPDGTITVLTPAHADEVPLEIDEVEAFARSVERPPGDSTLAPGEVADLDYAVLIEYAPRYPHPVYPPLGDAAAVPESAIPQPPSLALCASGFFLAAVALCGPREKDSAADHP